MAIQINKPDWLEWRFPYTGSELLPFVRKKIDLLRDSAEKHRAKVEQAERDRPFGDSETNRFRSELADLRFAITEFAIMAHEFGRRPGAEFFLSMKDVYSLGITESN